MHKLKILKEITEVGHCEELKVLELKAENLRVNCELTELQKVNARHVEWLKEKNDQVKELEAKQKHAELEKLDLQQQISMLMEESAAKTNQISMLIEESAAEELKVLELKAENLRVNCELTELQKVNARHIEWLKEKNDQVKELEAKQKHVELEKLDLQQQISTLMEESAAKTNQISMLIEESVAKTNQMKELEKMLTGIQEKEKELLTKIDDNLTEWRTKNSTL